MAKKDLNFDKLTLPKKPSLVKKGETENSVEKAVETIHNVVVPTPPTTTSNPSVSAASAPVSAATEPEMDLRLRKVSFDVPLDMYQFVKLTTIARTITMREYMVELIQEDMARRGGKEGLKEFYGFQ